MNGEAMCPSNCYFQNSSKESVKCMELDLIFKRKNSSAPAGSQGGMAVSGEGAPSSGLAGEPAREAGSERRSLIRSWML